MADKLTMNMKRTIMLISFILLFICVTSNLVSAVETTNSSAIINIFVVSPGGGGGTTTPTGNNSVSQTFFLNGTTITLYDMSLSYDYVMQKEKVNYIFVDTYDLANNHVDIQKISISFNGKTNVTIGQIGRTSVGKYKIPLNFSKYNEHNADFIVTADQFQKSISKGGTIELIESKKTIFDMLHLTIVGSTIIDIGNLLVNPFIAPFILIGFVGIIVGIILLAKRKKKKRR